MEREAEVRLERNARTKDKSMCFVHGDQMLAICGAGDTLDVFLVSRKRDLVASRVPPRVHKDIGTVVGVSPRRPVVMTRSPHGRIQLRHLVKGDVLQDFDECIGLAFAPPELGDIFYSPRGSLTTIWAFRAFKEADTEVEKEPNFKGVPYWMSPSDHPGRFVETGWIQGPFINANVCFLSG